MTADLVTVALPSLGEDVEQATISRRTVAPGDSIDVDAPLLAVATDTLGALGISIPSQVYLSFTYHHRLVDGADAARFLTTIRGRSETVASYWHEPILRPRAAEGSPCFMWT